MIRIARLWCALLSRVMYALPPSLSAAALLPTIPVLGGINQITRAQGNEEAAKIDSQTEAEARVRRAEIESEAAK